MARVDAYIDDMGPAYAWADLVICRAGALTISELAGVGMAAILVPYPFAVDDHQTANANILVQAQAAILLPQTKLSALTLSQHIRALQSHPSTLKNMAIKKPFDFEELKRIDGVGDVKLKKYGKAFIDVINKIN